MGELLRAQPRVHAPVPEVWQHLGVACAIAASPMGGWNGYAQLPPGSVYRRSAVLHVPVFSLTFGPDPDGWVGFDTGGQYWAVEDDQPGYVPDSWQLVDADGRRVPMQRDREAEAFALSMMRRVHQQLAASLPGPTWTLPRLRRHVERLAEILAVLR
jgi:hypothetical protein